jgi:asparagine synthase (glutamine-hydrolysing)
MCGIAGFLNFDATPVDAAVLADMIFRLTHRGPDGFGLHTDRQTGLAHRRLSIIDVAGGQQPMHDQLLSVSITFNGEIFNHIELRDELIGRGHRFFTRSDTEVLLRMYLEYGENCVDRLNGQWAFAIWDAPKEKLFLSRDRMGVRPLFYTTTPRSFCFASEIKALLAVPGVSAELDPRALDEIFTFWGTLPFRTAFKDIFQLPPGHSLVVQNGSLRLWRYWRLEYAPDEEFGNRAEAELAEELLALLFDATRIRLRADVRVGTYLSGGLDSTLITAIAAKLTGDRLSTFSVGFADAEFDESSYQSEASGFLETEHNALRCSGSDIAQVFPDVIWHAEQPILRTAPAPLFLLSRRVQENNIKVVLTGEGADETMGGYDIFKEAKVRRFWSREVGSSRRAFLLRRLYPYINGIQRQPPSYLRAFFHARDEDLGSPFFSHLPRWRLTAQLKRFFSADLRAQLRTYSAIDELEKDLPVSFGSWDTFNRAEYLEAACLLPGYILSSQGDRMAMGHSVEGRYPFLDHRVVEFGARLPARLKMRALNEKHLLKKAARGLIPESIRQRRKQPYRAPDGSSFFQSDAMYVRELLCADRLKRDGVFDPAAVAALVRKFTSGAATSYKDNMALVGLLSTGLVIDKFANRGQTSAAEWEGRLPGVAAGGALRISESCAEVARGQPVLPPEVMISSRSYGRPDSGKNS